VSSRGVGGVGGNAAFGSGRCGGGIDALLLLFPNLPMPSPRDVPFIKGDPAAAAAADVPGFDILLFAADDSGGLGTWRDCGDGGAPADLGLPALVRPTLAYGCGMSSVLGVTAPPLVAPAAEAATIGGVGGGPTGGVALFGSPRVDNLLLLLLLDVCSDACTLVWSALRLMLALARVLTEYKLGGLGFCSGVPKSAPLPKALWLR
jgi:hypothetical protein